MAILNDLVVKGPAKFLGSVDANLNVASAEKLTTSAGAGVNPIYFSGGKPVACTYSLNKSVPSNAIFTDNNVTNTLATTTKAYITGTTSPTTNTGTQVFDTGVYLDTTAGMLTATTFKGNLSGTASNADKLDGLHSTSFVNYKYTIGDTEMLNTANYTGAPYEGCVSDGSVMSLASHWWHIKYFRHANSDGFGCQVAFPLNNSTSLPQYRVSLGTTWQPWKVIGDGCDANTVDGKHASDFISMPTGVAVGTSATSGLADGIYFSTWTDHPAIGEDGQGTLMVSNYASYGIPSSWNHRIFISPHSGQVWHGMINNGTWYGWTRINDGGNADTVDGLHASDFMPINGEVRKYGLIRMNGSDGIRVRHIDGNDTEADGALYLNYNSPNAPIYMNGGNTAIHSGNIGSQSVNYANSAGNANTVGNVAAGQIPYSSVILDARDCNRDSMFTGIDGYTSSALNAPFAGWQTVMSYNCGHFLVQLAVETTSGNLAIRSKWGNTPFSDVSWVRYYGENYKPYVVGTFTLSGNETKSIPIGFTPSYVDVRGDITGFHINVKAVITTNGFTATGVELTQNAAVRYIAFR